MQNNPRRANPYTRMGAQPKKKGAALKRVLKRVLLICVLLAVLILGITGVRSLTSSSSKPVRINANPTDTIRAFGEDLIYYNGTTLYCVSNSGDTKWTFQLGMNGDFYASGEHVVAWAGNQVYVINEKGQSSYNDRMSDQVRFARIGDAYVSVCIGEEMDSSVLVMDHHGTRLESLEMSGVYVMDMGFFSSGEKLMWIYSLDVAGQVPISNLATYEPGRMSTGAVELNDTIIYDIYEHDDYLMVCDMSKITVYNYKCVEQKDIASVLTYGWQVCDTRPVGRTTYSLLTPLQSATASSETASFAEIRLVSNYSTQSMRLLSDCFAAGLTNKGVYGFGDNVIYYAPFGSKQFETHYLTYQITDLICMLDSGRAVLASGNDVFILKLPK